jgi:hypothetical protein
MFSWPARGFMPLPPSSRVAADAGAQLRGDEGQAGAASPPASHGGPRQPPRAEERDGAAAGARDAPGAEAGVLRPPAPLPDGAAQQRSGDAVSGRPSDAHANAGAAAAAAADAHAAPPPPRSTPSPAAPPPPPPAAGAPPHDTPPAAPRVLPPPRPLAPAWRTGFKGVAAAKGTGLFRMDFSNLGGGDRVTIVTFPSAEAAARAYDDIARERGLKVVNFPRPGAGEVRAVPGESYAVTLERAGVAPADVQVHAGVRTPVRRGGGELAHLRTESAAAVAPQEGPVLSMHERVKLMHRAGGGAAATPSASTPRTNAAARPAPKQPLKRLEGAAAGAARKHAGQKRACDANANVSGARRPKLAVARADADVQSFLRAISPPLSQLHAVLAALPASGITMAHLRNAGAISAGLRQLYVNTATAALRIASPADRLSFVLALDKLLAAQASGGGGGGGARDDDESDDD